MHALIATDGSDVSLDAARKAVALLRPVPGHAAEHRRHEHRR